MPLCGSFVNNFYHFSPNFWNSSHVSLITILPLSLFESEFKFLHILLTQLFTITFYKFKGTSPYDYKGADSDNHTARPCPSELLVEEHHSNYGEPWAGGRDVFEFLVQVMPWYMDFWKGPVILLKVMLLLATRFYKRYNIAFI